LDGELSNGEGASRYLVAPPVGRAFRMGFKDLRVYQAAQLLRKEADRILKKVPARFHNEVRHVDEAVDSILNNVAEGSAFRYPKKRIYFWQMAKGSANEAGGGFQSLVDRGGLQAADGRRAIKLAISIAKMLNNMH
jgi:four helix bundle protein